MAFLDETGLKYFYQKLKDIFGTVKTVNNVAPDENGNVKIEIPDPVIASQSEAEAGTDNTKHMTPLRTKQAINANAVIKSGSRGALAGYESSTTKSGSSLTITTSSPDEIEMNTSGSVTITFSAGAAGTCTTKVISLTASGTTTLTISGAVWSNGEDAPTWGTAGKHLVLVAHFVGQRVILNVFDNDQQ